MMSPLIKSVLKCDGCDRVSSQYETCISNFIPVNSTVQSLSDLHNIIQKPSVIEDALCSACKKGKMTQTREILRLPLVLIVTLLRFDTKLVTGRGHAVMYKKLYQHIKAPKVLTLEQTSDPGLNVAIYNHTG
jgi:ubiquitin C-terminal hydrolase